MVIKKWKDILSITSGKIKERLKIQMADISFLVVVE